VVKRPIFDLRRVLGLTDKLFGGELHAKRVLSLANAILGLLSCGTMRVHTIGQGLAEAQVGSRSTPSSQSTGCCS
jgi:hypothetical protein